MASAIQLIYPVGNTWTVTQDFAGHVARARENGWCTRPGTNCPAGYYYPAIDWGLPNRTPGRIAAPGIVIKAGLDPTTATNPKRGYGNRIQVMHDNGWQTVYAHLAEIYVTVGERVTPEKIAFLTDNTGYSTGPHIHFELRDEAGVPIDPMPYLTGTIVTPPLVEPPEVVVGVVELPLIDKFRIIEGPLRKRSEPSTKGGLATVVGLLSKGAIVTPERALIDGAWLDLGNGVFCAWISGGYVYAERAK